MAEQVLCPKCFVFMDEVLTRKGVLIDTCPSCKGVWLDQGELNFFTTNPQKLREYQKKGLQKAEVTSLKCARCPSPLQRGYIPGWSRYQVEECLACGGFFLDSHEFKKWQKSPKEGLAFRPDRLVKAQIPHHPSCQTQAGKKKIKVPPVRIPSLGLTAGAVCLGLYSALFAVIVFLIEIMNVSIFAGVGGLLVFTLAQFYFAPIVLDWQLKLAGSLKWVDLNNLPPEFKKSLTNLCAQNRLPIPKIGIINDLSPQAYTYGRTPKSGRVVFSKGMFELLDPEELSAVLAHELGHIKHWDFVLMTVIQVIPIIFYTIYRNIKTTLDDSQESKDKGGLVVGLLVAYIAYYVSEYLTLFVSRVREYHADRFSCFATEKPNKLLTALIKIAYGLLSTAPANLASANEEEGDNLSNSNMDTNNQNPYDRVRTLEALGIMSVARCKQLALARPRRAMGIKEGEGVLEQEGALEQGESGALASKGGMLDPEVVKNIMRWDLWSPWAGYYELHSTHPLTAKRINAIGAHAKALQQTPFLVFDKQKPESYWDDFFADLFVLCLPYILAVGGFFGYAFWMGESPMAHLRVLPEGEHSGKALLALLGPFMAGLLGLSVGALLRVLSAYPQGGFSPYSVSALLKLIKISPVRSYPVLLSGRILGRADAGYILAEDMVLQDKTGLIYLNHEPFGLNILFALFRYKKFKGQEVKITGWYRRSPSPYVEVKDMWTKDTKSGAYTYYYKIALSVLGMALPLGYFVLT